MTSPGGNEVGRISIRAVPDTSRFRKELAAKLEAIEEGLKAEVPVEPDMKGFRAKVRAATSNLPTAKQKVELDQNFFKRTLAGLSTSFDDAFKGPHMKLPLGSFMDSAALVAVAATFAAPALALLSGVLISLPGLMSAVVAPAGAIALGLEGISKAAGVLKTPLDNLKTVMAGAFESRLTPIFQDLGKIFPRLEGSMPAIANGLSDIARSFVDTVTSGPGMAKIDGIISNIGKSISDSAPGVANFTNGLLTLAEKFTAKMPGLSKLFNTIGDSFDKWVTKITTPGADGLSPFDKAMTSLRDTVKEILNLGGDLLSSGFKFLSDPEFGKKMQEFVDGLKNLVNDVLPGLGQFFEDITKFLSETNTLIDKIQSLDLLKRDQEKPKQDDPNKPGKTDGSFWDPFTSEDAGWRGMVEGAKNALANLSLTVQGLFNTMWNNVKAQALAVFASLPPALVANLSTAFGAIQNLGAVAFNGLVEAAATVAAQIIAQFARVPGALASAWSGLAGAAAGAWNAVVSVVAGALSTIVGQVVTVGGQIVAEVQSWGGKVAAAAQTIAGALVGIGPQMIQGFLNGFVGAAANAVSVVASWAAKIAAAARSALDIGSPSKVFAEIGTNVVQGFNQGFDQNSQTAIDRAKSLAEQITAAMNGGLEGLDTTALTDKLKASLEELELQRKGLKVEANAATDPAKKKSLQDQMKQIQTIKDQLALQKDQLKMSEGYGQELGKQDDMLGSSLTKMMDIGKGFAMANLKQFQSDIGIEGGGALTTLADIGLDWGSQMMSKLITGGMGGGTTINVNSVDEALTAKQTLANKQALQYTQRGP